jgi:hypothetical protein
MQGQKIKKVNERAVYDRNQPAVEAHRSRRRFVLPFVHALRPALPPGVSHTSLSPGVRVSHPITRSAGRDLGQDSACREVLDRRVGTKCHREKGATARCHDETKISKGVEGPI